MRDRKYTRKLFNNGRRERTQPTFGKRAPKVEPTLTPMKPPRVFSLAERIFLDKLYSVHIELGTWAETQLIAHGVGITTVRNRLANIIRASGRK